MKVLEALAVFVAYQLPALVFWEAVVALIALVTLVASVALVAFLA